MHKGISKLQKVAWTKARLLKHDLHFHGYTPARRYYIHKYLFWELISRKITFQLQENVFGELISKKLHIPYLFVIQRITWKNVLGIIFLANFISFRK